LSLVVHRANVQDRDGAYELLPRSRASFPFIERIFTDADYQRPKMAAAVARTGTWKLEIVKRTKAHRFVVLPKRWVVERTFAWISRNRRLARDFELYTRTVVAFIRLAMIRLMLRRLTRPTLAHESRLYGPAPRTKVAERVVRQAYQEQRKVPSPRAPALPLYAV
jgi:hypothetical protein